MAWDVRGDGGDTGDNGLGVGPLTGAPAEAASSRLHQLLHGDARRDRAVARHQVADAALDAIW